MTRRNPFKDNSLQPLDTVSAIPIAAARRHPRKWEKKNRAYSYFIPRPCIEKAILIRDSIVGIADGIREDGEVAPLATANDVAVAMMERSLHQVEVGKIVIDGRPDPSRRKMRLVFLEINADAEHNRPIPQRKTKPVSDPDQKEIYLAYRWSSEVDAKIKALANDNHLAIGEIVVTLLESALGAFRTGHLQLVPEPVTIRQTVAGVWP